MDPKKYDRGSRFAEIQSANPNKPTPGLKLDQEFDKIKSAIDAIGQALGVITRDDGALDNGSVGRDQISSDVSLGFDPPATWEVGKYYRDGKDTCFHVSKFWRCEESHSSETPFDETKWSMVADFAEATTAAETAKIAAEAARDLVLGYKQDAETAATSAETNKNTAETKAAEASQSAVSASNSAQTATTKAAETTQDRSDVATMKTAAETARDQAEAARDAAQTAAPPFPMSHVTGLEDALGGKADSAHTHEIGQVVGLASALADKAEKSSVKILAVHVFEQASRVAVSVASERKVFGGNFNKISETSKIVATCTVFGAKAHSGISGVGMVLDDQWDFGCGYQYDGSWQPYQTTLVVGTSDFGVVPAGAKRIDFGWKTGTGGNQERPFVYLSPSQSDDTRNQQTVSRIIVYEIEV